MGQFQNVPQLGLSGRQTGVVFITTAALIVIFIIIYIYRERERESARQYMPVQSLKLKKPTAIVHIGSHKVASSYIQSRMCSDSETLIGFGLWLPLPTECKPKYHLLRHSRL